MFRKLSNLIAVFTVCLLSVDGLRVDQKCVPPAEWDYGTPIVWGNYDLCTCGTHQSPVDLPKNSKKGNASSAIFKNLRYSAVAKFNIDNNGRELTMGPFDSSENGFRGELLLPDGEYDLRHLNLKVPSEHTIDGKQVAAELQMMHFQRHPSSTHNIAIVSILFEQSKTDETGFLEELLGKEFPKAGTEWVATFNVKSLARPLMGGLYHYEGSLTSPPCTESVHWYVMEETAPVSANTITSLNDHLPPNSRPVGAPNSVRVVKDSISIGREYPPRGVEVKAKITEAACAGDTEIYQDTAARFKVGDWVLIGEIETRQVSGFGSNSILIDKPLELEYHRGTVVHCFGDDIGPHAAIGETERCFDYTCPDGFTNKMDEALPDANTSQLNLSSCCEEIPTNRSRNMTWSA